MLCSAVFCCLLLRLYFALFCCEPPNNARKIQKKKLGVSCSYVFVQNNDLKPVFIAMPHNLLCARSESEDGLAQCFSNQHTTWIAKGYHQHGTQFTHDLMYGGALT